MGIAGPTRVNQGQRQQAGGSVMKNSKNTDTYNKEAAKWNI